MVQIDYINGDSETIETVDCKIYKYDGISDTTEIICRGHFWYDNKTNCFIVNDHKDFNDCMMIPREFVKSIRHIEV